jgi:hypothetical protein
MCDRRCRRPERGICAPGAAGQGAHIDLSARNSGALRRILGPCAVAGRRVASARRGRTRLHRQVPSAVDSAAVRAWAIGNDYEISARGRVSAAIIEEYRAAAN